MSDDVVKKTEELRKLRNRILWSSLRKACGTDDGEILREVREIKCYDVTRLTRGDKKCTGDYTMLTLDELQSVIDYVKTGKIRIAKAYASSRQLAQLHHVAMLCAVRYAKFEPQVNSRGQMLSVQDVRQRVLAALDGREVLTSCEQARLYEWIVPKIASWYESYAEAAEDPTPSPIRRSGTFVQWNKMSASLVQHLINRFNAMYAEESARYVVRETNYSLN